MYQKLIIAGIFASLLSGCVLPEAFEDTLKIDPAVVPTESYTGTVLIGGAAIALSNNNGKLLDKDEQGIANDATKYIKDIGVSGHYDHNGRTQLSFSDRPIKREFLFGIGTIRSQGDVFTIVAKQIPSDVQLRGLTSGKINVQGVVTLVTSCKVLKENAYSRSGRTYKWSVNNKTGIDMNVMLDCSQQK
jgi:hypothetical protein